MEREEFRNIPKPGKRVFNDSLNLVTKFMTFDKDNKDEYKNNLIKSIISFKCKRTDKDEVTKELKESGCIAVCRQISRRNFVYKKLRIYPKNTKFESKIIIDDLRLDDYLSNLLITLHEVNHADTNQYARYSNGTIYYGLKKVHDKPLSKKVILGDGLNEFMNELYAQVQFYEVYNDAYLNIESIDDLIYKASKPKFTPSITSKANMYMEIGKIAKLLLIACDNDMTVSYSSLEDNGEPFVNKSVTLNGETYAKNDLIYAGKYGVEQFEKSFNRLCDSDNAFEKISKDFDLLLSEIKSGLSLNKQVISRIINQIDYFKERRFDALVSYGTWDEQKRNYSEMMYRNLRNYLIYTYDIKNAKVTNLEPEKATIYKLNNKTGN